MKAEIHPNRLDAGIEASDIRVRPMLDIGRQSPVALLHNADFKLAAELDYASKMDLPRPIQARQKVEASKDSAIRVD
jgi:hypothetical protein